MYAVHCVSVCICIKAANTTFYTFDMSVTVLTLNLYNTVLRYFTTSTPLTLKRHLIYSVDSNTKSLNYMKIQIKDSK